MTNRILVVVSDADMQCCVCDILSSERYSFDTSSNSTMGVYMAAQRNYDAIVLDDSLPVLDGWQVRDELRTLKATPVLMLTSHDVIQGTRRDLVTDIDDFLIKPPQRSELLDRLRKLIVRYNEVTPSLIALDDVVVDTVSRTVTRDRTLVPLTTMEYAIVELVARHHKSLVTRSMIMKTLYNGVKVSSRNRVDAHVANIRRKMGRQYIRTRRGHGFTFR